MGPYTCAVAPKLTKLFNTHANFANEGMAKRAWIMRGISGSASVTPVDFTVTIVEP